MSSPLLKSPPPRSRLRSNIFSRVTVEPMLSMGMTLGFVVFSTTFIGLSSIAIAQDKPSSTRIDLSNQAEYSYGMDTQPGYTSPPLEYRGKTARIEESFDRLVDPLGRIVGCAGETLPSYNGFSVAFYDADPSDPTGASIGRLTAMTRTEFPDIPKNGIAPGLQPNVENNNPYAVTDGTQGTYNFLFDPSKGQLDQGRAYILVVNTPPVSVYTPRRIRIVMGPRLGNQVTYTATSLDGKPLAASNGQSSTTGTITINDAETTALSLAVFDLATGVCQAQEIQIVKSGDRASASPGDIAIYRLSVRNLASAPVKDLNITDNLPVGFKFVEGSARAEFLGVNQPIVTTQSGNNGVLFTLPNVNLPAATSSTTRQTLNIAYGAILTPDAVRGTGVNLASVSGLRTDNNQSVKDGPATHKMRITPGILADCGTIIGRVFEDKNFDGEQQNNEPGIPNAVVILDDGNRITTDANGLFSVANVQPGYRSGVLDFSSLPGYTLAPNRKFKERNSQSRLVNLAPSGLVRMNFAVTPAFQEAGK
jgi:uncharacterized repeat protein (TIGR01451 family)